MSALAALDSQSQQAELRARLLQTWPRVTTKGVLTVAAALVIYAWGMAGTQASPVELARGVPNMLDFMRRLAPPQWDMQQVPLAVSFPISPGLLLTVGWPSAAIGVPEIVLSILRDCVVGLDARGARGAVHGLLQPGRVP